MSPSKLRVFKFLHQLHDVPIEAVEALSEGQALMVGNDLEDARRAFERALQGIPQAKIRGEGVMLRTPGTYDYTTKEKS